MFKASLGYMESASQAGLHKKTLSELSKDGSCSCLLEFPKEACTGDANLEGKPWLTQRGFQSYFKSSKKVCPYVCE